jgi:hypothetical protein
MKDDTRKRLGISLVRGLARLLGVDMVAFNAEVARLDTLRPEQLEAETAKAMRELGRRGNRGRTARDLLDAVDKYSERNKRTVEQQPSRGDKRGPQ